MYRNTYVEVDGNILKSNIKEIRSKYPDYKYYIGVVKANCYGHGMYVVNDLLKGGINYLAVSSLEEAIEVRKYNTMIPILCLEPIGIEYLSVVTKNNITITLSNYDYFKELVKINYKGIIHLKLDTGMSRLGIKDKEEVNNIIASKLNIEGIYTHFATSGIYDNVWDKQLSKFKYLTNDIDLGKIPIVHLGRSLTLVNHPKMDFVNGIRLGIIMFGLNQSISLGNGIKGKLREMKRDYFAKKFNLSKTTLSNDLKLSTGFCLYSEVMEIRKIESGDIVGYGAIYKEIDNSYIATIPIGYADGISGKIKEVIISDKIYSVVGSICMDMIMVKVDNSIRVHDKVTLIGGKLNIKKVATSWGVNAYHVFSGISSRVPRVYINKKERKEIKY